MKKIIRVERKRILTLRNFLILSTIILIFSIFSSIMSLNNYNVYDSQGSIIISSKDNLKESKLNKHNTLLNEKTLKDIVERKDKGKYLYNSNLVTLVASNYEKKVKELTNDDIRNFYNQRILKLKENIGGAAMVENIDKLASEGEKLNTPLQLGYTEGWKNLNNDMIDFVTIVIFVIPFIILSVFAQDPKTKMRQLYITTKHGKKTLVKAKIITGFQVGSMIYITAVLIFSLSKLSILGFKGASLSIQSSVNYLFCPYNMTYLQQYLLNVTIGFMAMLVMVSTTLLFTAIVDQILSGAIFVTFFCVIMTMLPNNNFQINHYFKNFLPYHMINFDSYYIHPEIYNISGKIIPTYVLVILISLLAFTILTTSTFIISSMKLKSKLK
ncbi:ABC-2 family transporter protein [Clostridium sporogenes]|uniref:hypothetical protein n=1 Tax=Clostridium botulinum TaxID=1491 RepID=UPI0007176316|nr:hypothetical protein [Clostridium botulinum]KRU26800.1 ABC-2 family transporter protein [Clostridium sporogenes]KRU29664.1 ABC-2 family transporter protein [Clostridium sporogenes]KRU35429.1 ABC-2 family transporter protein [Clostridium sporogenes]KRU49654.1 ABC-2 family transporter protein [Clostridium sporogenes]MBZ1328449.1 hypothetical protein [Clostridium botulinum]